jgi:hypothetical protein
MKELDQMETAVGIEKRWGFYRGYLTDARSPIPLTIVVGTTVAMWALVYLIGAIGHPYKPQMGLLQHASTLVALSRASGEAPRH